MQNTKQVLDWDNKDIFKRKREFYLDEDLVDKIDSIEYGAQVNKIEEIEVNWVPVEPDESKTVKLKIPRVINAVTSDSESDALSAAMGKYLYTLISEWWGWGWNWKQAFFKTQAEYDALPASKESDGNLYIIVDSHLNLMPYAELIELTPAPDAILTELNTYPKEYAEYYSENGYIYMQEYPSSALPRADAYLKVYEFSVDNREYGVVDTNLTEQELSDMWIPQASIEVMLSWEWTAFEWPIEDATPH